MKKVSRQVLFQATTAHFGHNDRGRTTYVMAVSRDGGDYLLITYYYANGTGIPLTSTKMIKVTKDELTG